LVPENKKSGYDLIRRVCPAVYHGGFDLGFGVTRIGRKEGEKENSTANLVQTHVLSEGKKKDRPSPLDIGVLGRFFKSDKLTVLGLDQVSRAQALVLCRFHEK
jgi:hypothetical protein